MSVQQTTDEVLIVQLSDSHLRKEENGELLGMNTRESLDAVIDLVKQHHAHPDMILATGDLAQDGHEESYRCFQQKLDTFACPAYWYTGNHDNRQAMKLAAQGTSALQRRILTDHWQIILLDSLVEGKVYGHLADSELRFLDACLSEYPDKYAMVCFHHHPIDIDSEWLDNIGLKNRDALFAILDKYVSVKVILWGHIHQEIDQIKDNRRLLATPSTCVQFLPKSKDFAVDTLSPGYRWIKLKKDGSLETGVNRAHHIDFQVDYNSKGY